MPHRILIGFALRDEARHVLDAVPPAMVDRLRAIDPGVEVVYAPVSYDAGLHARMRTEPFAALLAENDRFQPDFLAALPRADVVLSLLAPVDLVQRAPRVRWLANPGSGSDQFQAHGLPEAGVVLTSSKGVAGRSIAQFALGQLVWLARRGPQRLANQHARHWQLLGGRDLENMTLGIVGTGEIGSEVARLAKAFGMQVLGVRRTPQPTPNVDEVLPATQLGDMLRRCDAVVVAAAFTPETAGMFGPAAFAAVKPGAILINVSRGGIVDEDALCAALNDGRLSAAACDVFAAEPLPPHSPLWQQPGLFISAHDAVGLGDYAGAVLNRFTENFAAFVKGGALRGVVDPALGY